MLRRMKKETNNAKEKSHAKIQLIDTTLICDQALSLDLGIFWMGIKSKWKSLKCLVAPVMIWVGRLHWVLSIVLTKTIP